MVDVVVLSLTGSIVVVIMPTSRQEMDMTKTYPAILNGQRTTAKKVLGQWLVGGDYTQAGDVVSIACKVWRSDRIGWHTLKGCRLVFSDFASADELEG
jgi:hypothetical protein